MTEDKFVKDLDLEKLALDAGLAGDSAPASGK